MPKHVRPGSSDDSAIRRIRHLVQDSPLALLSRDVVRDLERELGSADQVATFLRDLATEMQKPIAVNFPQREESYTVIIAPRGWTREKLAGYVGAHKNPLEREYGPVEDWDVDIER